VPVCCPRVPCAVGLGVRQTDGPGVDDTFTRSVTTAEGATAPGTLGYNDSASTAILAETVNGDGSPFPAPVGARLRDGGTVAAVHADGTYSVRSRSGQLSRARPSEVMLAR
jgi:hypothetical protein